MIYEINPCEVVNGAEAAGMQNARMAIIDAPSLKAELSKKGRSQAALSRHMGVDQASVNRMVNGTRLIKIAEIPLIESYLEATGGAPFRTEPIATVSVLGAVEAGAWREMGLIDDGETIPVVVMNDSGKLFALRVTGPSMNLKYPDGTYVIARHWEGGAWPIGKNVIVQRTDTAGKIETTLKELVLGDLGLELWPRSSDPRHQEPIHYKNGDDTVEIIGRVVSSWRSEE